jgi:cytochrome c biogenesis protein
VSQSDGILIQDLPFAIELKKFIVEYYSTGMPKLFASDIVIHDKATGEKQEARVEVNHPAHFKGIEIYQSSFDDGGSRVKLQALPMQANTKAFEVEGIIGSRTDLTNGQDKLSLEFSGLRVINVKTLRGRMQRWMCAKWICAAPWMPAWGPVTKPPQPKNCAM